MTRVLARLSGIERRFGSVVALDGADLELAAGEVHGVLGANGAGKSTLFNVLGGMLRPDAGTIEVEGERVVLPSPRDAWDHGIGLVHQHFTLVPTLSVIENLALGSRGKAAAPASVRAAAVRIMERTGLRVPLEPRAERLGVGDRQRIEILKALLRDPKVLVLDEPTAVLTPDEIRGLFDLLGELAGEGRAVALVAHKVDEVLSVADRVTVLRDGRTVLTAARGERSIGDYVQAMVGDDTVDPIALGLGERLGSDPGSPVRPSDAHGPRGEQLAAGSGVTTPAGTTAHPATTTQPIARLRGVGFSDERGSRLRGVDLDVAPGEVLGVAGVEGNGQRELALILAGRLAPTEGTVGLPEGVGFVSQDRSTEGLIGEFDLTENVALAFHRRTEFRRGWWLRWERLEEAAEEIRSRYEVAAPSVDTLARALSGGNRQRVIVGRELAMASDLLVAENPTRGLDVSAAAFVHEELRRLAAKGVAVVLLSTDLDEVLGLSGRILAIARGRLTEVPDGERTRAGIGALMLGGVGNDG